MSTHTLQIIHTDQPMGSTQHYQHYSKEYDRIKALAYHASAQEADLLNMELQHVTLILQEYEY